VDEASLVKVGEETVVVTATATSSTGPARPTATSQPDAALPTSTPTTAPVTNTPAATGTSVATRTPRPDGAVVHVVQSGDTLYAISLQYNVPLDNIYTLNNLTRESILSVGQEIVVQVGQGTAVAPSPTNAPKATNTPQTAPPQSPLTTPTPPAQSPLVTPTPQPPVSQPTVTPVKGGLCLAAFEDANGNTVRDGDEPSLAGVTFIILSGGSEVARYTADGSTRSYCLTTLPPGAYSVEVTLPAGYVAAFEKTDVALAPGQRVDLVVAAQHGEKGTPTPAAQPTQAPASAGSSTALIAGALFVAVFLILIGVAMVIIRRGR
jgi:LysM repeat protein